MPEKNESSQREACGLPKQEMPVRMQSSRQIFARGAAGTRMSTRGGRRCR